MQTGKNIGETENLLMALREYARDAQGTLQDFPSVTEDAESSTTQEKRLVAADAVVRVAILRARAHLARVGKDDIEERNIVVQEHTSNSKGAFRAALDAQESMGQALHALAHWNDDDVGVYSYACLMVEARKYIDQALWHVAHVRALVAEGK